MMIITCLIPERSIFRTLCLRLNTMCFRKVSFNLNSGTSNDEYHVSCCLLYIQLSCQTVINDIISNSLFSQHIHNIFAFFSFGFCYKHEYSSYIHINHIHSLKISSYKIQTYQTCDYNDLIVCCTRNCYCFDATKDVNNKFNLILGSLIQHLQLYISSISN